MSALPFRLIDAFAETAFEGNSAGVVVDGDDLTDQQMQLIAREVNAAETAFVYQPDASGVRRLRWFTPTTEVDFCGRATLAAAENLRLDGHVQDGALTFDCRVGTLRLLLEELGDDWIWFLEVPEPKLTRAGVGDAKVRTLLNLSDDALDPDLPPQQTSSDDLLVFVRSWQTLQDLRPEAGRLHDWCDRHNLRGIFVSTRNTQSSDIHAASRFFAPAAGVEEDPVTGSAHGPLAAALFAADLAPRVGPQAALNCVQGIPGGRTGLVRVLMEQLDDRLKVQVAGRCHETIHGTIRVPTPR